MRGGDLRDRVTHAAMQSSMHNFGAPDCVPAPPTSSLGQLPHHITAPVCLYPAQFSVPGARNYIASGEGSINSIVKAVRKEREKKAQQEKAAKQRKQEVDERGMQALAALEAAGVSWGGRSFAEVPPLHAFVQHGARGRDRMVCLVAKCKLVG